jgi:conjugative relaxase-like TrwC/TraI family protein
MTGTLKVISSGDGYTYLTRQVAYNDVEKGSALERYYSEKGEKPGTWHGKGLDGLEGVQADDVVTGDQMLALFGEGRQPNANAIEARLVADGKTPDEAMAATKLGSKFPDFAEAPDFLKRCAVEFRDVNIAAGRRWNAALPDGERAAIRTQVALNMFTEIHDRAPNSEQELHGFIARNSRPSKTAHAGYDMTFSPVKSISTLWAVAPMHVSNEIERCHREAVLETLAWFESNVAYTRGGAGGRRKLNTRGVSAAVFQHRDSRSGDPDLHTHVAVSSKVQGPDGKWRGLDAKVVFKAMVSTSEQYNTLIETKLRAVGLEFRARLMGEGKRPVREIVGVSPQLNEVWSSRAAAIRARQSVLAVRFQETHARPPNPQEAIALAQQANAETRDPKHELKSLAEQRAEWRETAVATLGERGLAEMINASASGMHPSRASEKAADNIGAFVTPTAERVVANVADGRANWTFWHVRAEAQRLVRDSELPPDIVGDVVDQVTRASLYSPDSVRLTTPDMVEEMAPELVHRPDGSRVYEEPHSTVYTSRALLEAERRVVDAAGLGGGAAVRPEDVELAKLEWSANSGGKTLNNGQDALVMEMATSGKRLQLGMAPAGTGKTTAMGVLSRAWVSGGGNVVGFSPTAAAASELSKALGGQQASTLDLLRVQLGLPPGRRQAWVNATDSRSLFIVDEAGMASTKNLDVVVRFALSKGASVRFIGDERQLSSVAAGGLLRDIRAQHGAVALTEVVRFTDPAEAAPSLALAAGDVSALGYYLDKGRVHAGDATTAIDAAFQKWEEARLAGKDAVICAPTNEIVRGLNERARAARLGQESSDPGTEIVLADGLTASVGETVLTRKNDYSLQVTETDFVKNGDRWIVEKILPDGSLKVRSRTGISVRTTLPAEYVRENVRLGYAATGHSVEGVTADVCLAITDGRMTRNLLYVVATRGREENHLFVPVTDDGDPHTMMDVKSLSPSSAAEVLEQILARKDQNRSATTTIAELSDPARRLGDFAGRYLDAIPLAAESALDPGVLADIDRRAVVTIPGIEHARAWETLRDHLAVIALDGGDPIARLIEARDQRPLTGAGDVAAVLDYRLDKTGNHSQRPGVLPWLPAVPSTCAQLPEWDRYLTARNVQLADLADQVLARAHSWTPTTAPEWARPYLSDKALTGDLAVWRASWNVPDEDLRPTGAPSSRTALRTRAAALTKRAVAVGGDLSEAGDRWAPLLPESAAAVVQDPMWPVLAGRLNTADAAGVPVLQRLTEALNEGPLPVEQAASALWWRMSVHIDRTGGDRVFSSAVARPAWTPVLAEQLGEARAEAVLADSAWPSIVARVDQAVRDGVDPRVLMENAAGLVAAHTDNLPMAQTGTALLYQVGSLADPVPFDPEYDVAPPDPVEAERERPVDAEEAYLVPPPASREPEIEYTDDDLPPDESEVPPDPTLEDPMPAVAAVDHELTFLPADTLPPAERLAELNRQLQLAKAAYAELDAQVNKVTVGGAVMSDGPMLRAAMPVILDAQRRTDQLAPYRHEVAWTHAQYSEADRAAELAADEAQAAARDMERALDGGEPAHVVDVLALEAAQAQLVAEGSAQVAATQRTRWETAQAAFAASVGDGPIVAPEDVEAVRGAAIEMDHERLNELRGQAQRLEWAVWRAEASLQREAVGSTVDRGPLAAVAAPVRVSHRARRAERDIDPGLER